MKAFSKKLANAKQYLEQNRSALKTRAGRNVLKARRARGRKVLSA